MMQLKNSLGENMQTIDDLIEYLKHYNSDWENYGHNGRDSYRKGQIKTIKMVIGKAKELKENMEAVNMAKPEEISKEMREFLGDGPIYKSEPPSPPKGEK